MALKTKLQRDKVVSIVEGKELVGLTLEKKPKELLLECSPSIADLLIKLWGNENDRDIKEVIMYDLEALKDCFTTQNKEDFDYHFNLLKGNLKDLL